MFNLGEFVKAAGINTLVLLPIIMALVTWYGKMGVTGRAQLVASLATGFVLGVGAQVATTGVPQDFAGGFALFLFGLIPGLVASGVYEVGRDLGVKAVERIEMGNRLDQAAKG